MRFRRGILLAWILLARFLYQALPLRVALQDQIQARFQDVLRPQARAGVRKRSARCLQLLEEPRERLHMEHVDFRQLLELRGLLLVMRHGVVRFRHANLRVGSDAFLAAEQERADRGDVDEGGERSG